MAKQCKCGSLDFFTKKSGNNTGLYCSMCGKWQKWLNKDEIRLFEHYSTPKKKKIKMTNADRIRSMTDEELAEWLYNTCDFFENGTDDPKVGIWNLDTSEEEIIDDSYGDFLEWLKAERKR